jgi:electron transport complex protein RnfB
MSSIIISVVVLGLIAITVGLLLAVAQKVFYVEADKRVQKIYDMLPHYDCGACGTAGCMDMAGQLVDKNIKIAKCRPAKPDQKEAIENKLKELNLLD